jgi:hypothetical protein
MGSFKGDTNSRRIDRALQHVSKPWFPMNPEVLKRVREGFDRGTYTQNFSLLLEELKSDFALFTFVVKELSQKAVLEGIPQATVNHPIELLKWGGVSAIRNILEEQQKIPSVHSLQWSEPFQIQRLRETAIIATTASELSRYKNLDPELGFSRGVIREIGLNLIAWNYPSVYTKAINSLSIEQELDDELAKELGFTPALLAMRLFRPDRSADTPPEDGADESWATYDELCEVGEALARAEHPETYPSAENDWKVAKTFLSEAIGDQAITIIRDRAIENSRHYQKSLPEVFGTLQSFNPEKQLECHRRVSRVLDEAHVGFCSETLLRGLKQLYSEISDDAVNKPLVARLLKELVPEAGFSGGCVFVVDPSSLSLKPRTIVGRVQLRKITNVALEPGDPAVAALSASKTLSKLAENSGEAPLVGLYSALGNRKKIGVLYLEAPRGTESEVPAKTLGLFQIIQKALCDVLLLD